MSAPVEKVRAADLLARLRRHYLKPGPFPGGVFVPECGQNGEGLQRCDALYVGFTSSSGRILVGHEIKVSRADWRHELDQPDKADGWADQCHAWYVVAPSTAEVPPEELPHGWGLLVPNPRTSTRMDVKVRAAVHAERVPAWWAVRSIMARLDTLQQQEQHEYRTKLNQEHLRALDQERADLRARGAGDDPRVARVVKLLARVRAEGGEDFRYKDISDDDFVTALIDIGRSRAAADALKWDLQRMVRDARELSQPFANAYGALAELLAQAEATS